MSEDEFDGFYAYDGKTLYRFRKDEAAGWEFTRQEQGCHPEECEAPHDLGLVWHTVWRGVRE